MSGVGGRIGPWMFGWWLPVLLLGLVPPERRCGADQVLDPKLPPIMIPQRSATNLGFTVRVEVAEHDISGYVPVRVTCNSPIALTAERRLTIRFAALPGGRTPPRNDLVVDVPLVLAQGTRITDVVRYLPKWSAGHAYHVIVLENGQPLLEYEGVTGNAVVFGSGYSVAMFGSELRSDWLSIGETQILTNQDQIQLTRMSTQVHRSLGTSRGHLGRIGEVSIRGAGQSELPDDWRGYQRYDVVLVSPQSMQSLSQQPQRFEALRQWVLCGGVVCGHGFPVAEKLVSQLNFQPHQDPELDRFLQRVLIRSRQISAAIQTSDGSQILRVTPPGDGSRSMIAAEQLIWAQPAGAGLVMGMTPKQEDLMPSHWMVARALLTYRVSPTVRRGVDPMLGDARFRRWLIPGVAQPPVYTFIGILTVFVILVGPIAYRRTTRYGRGYLMFAIAPLLALITTLAMFGYGIVADGFGTIARVRQVTWIDGASGDAGERVRATYFAGIRPAEGLQFSGQAEVLGYRESTGLSLRATNELAPATWGKVTVTEDRQLFSSDFLPSRQQRQFVTHQPRPGLGGVSLGRPAGRRLQVRSTLDFDLTSVVLRDTAGDHWFVAELPAGGTVEPVALERKELSETLGGMYNRYRPLSAVSEANQSTRVDRREIRDFVVSIHRDIGSPRQGVPDGLFEDWLVDRLTLGSEIPENYFVALAEVSEDVVAVQGTDVVESVRYVIGTMP